MFLNIYLSTVWIHGFSFDKTIKNIKDSPWTHNMSCKTCKKPTVTAKLQPSLHWAAQHTSSFSRIEVNNIKKKNKFTKSEDWQLIVYEKSWSRVCETHSWGMKNHINLWTHRHTNNIFSVPKHVRKFSGIQMSSHDSVLLLWLHGKGVAHMKMTDSGTRGTQCGSRGEYDHRFNAVSSSPQVQTKPEMHPFLKCSRNM